MKLIRRTSPALILALVALFVALAGVGGAANGQNLILGKADNSATLKTGLSAPINDRALQLTNTNTGTSATALGLVVASGRPPLVVNSTAGKATNLNADKLDGNDSNFFLPKTGKAADADKLDNHDSSFFLSTTGTAANAGQLDGIDSSGFWQLGGNAPGSTGILGTTTNQALELEVNGARALRLEPNATSPNLIGGFSTNAVQAGALGATISGGGASLSINRVRDNYGTVGGGQGNVAGNTADDDPTTATHTTVAGGRQNTASNNYATVGGGDGNIASGDSSVVAGGSGNTASNAGSTVAGGGLNTASGQISFAAGLRAKATQDGSFVWGDLTQTDLTSPAQNTFTVRATNGIWLGTTSSPTNPAASTNFIETRPAPF